MSGVKNHSEALCQRSIRSYVCAQRKPNRNIPVRRSVSESRHFAFYGAENYVTFTVTVTPTHGSDAPNGDPVTIDVGTASCVATLAHGVGTCTIGATDLLVGGPYAVSATFAGDSGYSG